MRGTMARSPAALRRAQVLVVALLFGGYASLYFCRADLSVAGPLLVDQLTASGMPREAAIVHYGQIGSLGVLAYALGKLFLGGLGDFWGGRPNFLIGLAGATVFTAAFAAGGTLPVFTVAWIGNRLTQSLAWAGLIKVSSRWFDYSAHGTVIGILSVSYLIGDALARNWMGRLIAHGHGWQAVFVLAALAAGFMLVANLVLLRESRARAGWPEATANPLNLYGTDEARAPGVRALLKPLLSSPSFLLVCALSLGCTIVRETFNTWTPLYLRDHAGYTTSSAASFSAVFPAVGAVSVIVTGWLGDRMGENGRALILMWGLAASGLALLALTLLVPTRGGSLLAVAAIGLVAFCLLGPYSYLGGAFALDFGGKQGGAVASGLIDGVGYLGGVVAGDSIARLAVGFGWRGVFVALALVCALGALSAVYLYRYNRRVQRTLAAGVSR